MTVLRYDYGFLEQGNNPYKWVATVHWRFHVAGASSYRILIPRFLWSAVHQMFETAIISVLMLGFASVNAQSSWLSVALSNSGGI
jgi:hypothetical protein